MSERLESFGQHIDDADGQHYRDYGELMLRQTQADSIATARGLLASGAQHFIDPSDFLFTHSFKGERYFFFRSKDHGVVALHDGDVGMVYAPDG